MVSVILKLALLLLLLTIISALDQKVKKGKIWTKPSPDNRIRRKRPNSPKMYIIKCCGAKNSCINPIRKSKPSHLSTTSQTQNFSSNRPSQQIKTTVRTSSSSDIKVSLLVMKEVAAGVNTVNGAETIRIEELASDDSLDESISAFTGVETVSIAMMQSSTMKEESDVNPTLRQLASTESTSSTSPAPSLSQLERMTTNLTSSSPQLVSSSTAALQTHSSQITKALNETQSVGSTTTTSTTTTTPTCIKSACNAIKPAEAQTNASVSIFTGKYRLACGRNYYVAENMANVSTAALTCSSLNMSLLSVETIAEMLCMLKLIPPDFKYKIFMTSGSNEGDGCDGQGVYSWCSQNSLQLIPNLLNSFLKPSANASNERCISFNASTNNSSALTHTNCANNQIPFICEPTCISSTCPATLECAKNVSLFGPDGKVKEPNNFGVWMETCGDTYLFGNKPVSWELNWKTCCSLGMEPLLIESLKELQCLSNVTKNGTWSGNFNYWTGGTQRDCRGSWSWCGKEGRKLFSDDVTWDKDQPDNKGGREDCIHLKLKKDASGQPDKFVLTDRNCTDKYILACKGNPSRPESSSLNCSLVEKPNICAKNLSLFNGTALLNVDSYGKWLGACGKYFMFSTAKANWTTARDKCCSIGLTLAAIPTMGKKQCLDKMISSEREGIEEDFWLYGTDNGCSPGNMHWCSNFRPFEPKEVTWAAGEPSGKGSCVYMHSSNASTLAVANCSTEMRFLCDVRKKGTDSMAMQQECRETWGVTEVELELVTNTSVDIQTLGQHVKCFVKCMGEFAGLFALGALVPGEMLKMIEEASSDDPVQLQSGFSAYDECSNIKHDDECVTASQMFSCGRDKEPEIVDLIFDAEKGNATVFMPPVPCIPVPRNCYFTKRAPACILNPTLQDELAQTNKSMRSALLSIAKVYNNKFAASFGKLIHLPKMNKMAFLSNITSTMTYETAWSSCCSIGMKPIEFPDYQEVYSKLLMGNGQPGSGNLIFMYIGETEVLNATHERWCQSKEPIQIAPILLNAKITNTCLQGYMYYMIARVDGNDVGYQGFAPNKTAQPLAMRYACL